MGQTRWRCIRSSNRGRCIREMMEIVGICERGRRVVEQGREVMAGF